MVGWIKGEGERVRAVNHVPEKNKLIINQTVQAYRDGRAAPEGQFQHYQHACVI